MRETHIHTYTLNDCETPVSLSGHGTPLVLCHGGPATRDYLDDLAPLFPAQIQLIRYTQRGAPSTPEPFSLNQQIADLEALRNALGLEQWLVGGHSWGAFLALAYAVAHPERCLGLVLLNGTGLNPDWQKQYRLNRRKKLPPAHQIEALHLQQELEEACGGKSAGYKRRLKILYAPADLHDPARVAEIPNAGPANPPAQAALMQDWLQTLADPAFVAAARALELPLLCVHGSADPRPGSGAQELAASVRHGQWVELANCGHYPWVEQPVALQTALHAFLTPWTQTEQAHA
ncbi:MAG: alpha/beta fold hydrolase [Candidatus Sericytochromatia bacterium]